MYFITLAALLFLSHSYSASAQTTGDWVGTWNDPILGGTMPVCVSTDTSGTVYGQAIMSLAGYLRGTITVSGTNVIWNGTYYWPGLDQRTGAFTYILTGNADTTFTVTSFVDGPLGDIANGQTGSNVDSVVPTDQACFNTDVDYINTLHNYTGLWGNGYTVFNIEDQLDGTLIAAYKYSYASDPDTPYDSSNIGYKYATGHVVPGQYYEQGATQGIQMWVAKSATEYYYLWWGIDTMSAFDALCDPGNTCGQSTYTIVAATLQNPANEYNCLGLDTVAEENACFTTSSSAVTTNVETASSTCYHDSDDDTTNGNLAPMINGAFAFSIINFVLIVLVLAWVTTRPGATAGLALQGSSAPAEVEMK